MIYEFSGIIINNYKISPNVFHVFLLICLYKLSEFDLSISCNIVCKERISLLVLQEFDHHWIPQGYKLPTNMAK